MKDVPPHGPDARRRVVIEDVCPSIDHGQWPIKRAIDEVVEVSATLFADGHDQLRGEVEVRCPGGDVRVSPLRPSDNDRHVGGFAVTELGRHQYRVRAWVDEPGTWFSGLGKKIAAKQDVEVDLLVGARLLEAAADRADDTSARRLKLASAKLRQRRADIHALAGAVELAGRFPAENAITTSATLPLTAHPSLARFSSWYEFFPRSFGKDGKHGTLVTALEHLDYVADLGFDVVYLPPIHPIGDAHRKGPNNTLVASDSDPGSPWAIGSADGGHKAVHPELGSLADFDAFVLRAQELGMDVALDIAFQASPDHPWVKSHPTWFTQRPDGTIQYAENPPKKYQDIFPLNFDTDDWQALWAELRSVFEFWFERGVRVFRVDNPHTKSFKFWQWCVADLYDQHPEVVLLSEAFTKPSVMYRLAKLGFTQSYTYFTWRNDPTEMAEYMRELTTPPVSDFFGPNFWPNTPDILPEHLQSGSRAAFVGRAILAATLSSNYGIYGPAYELMEHLPRPGSGEYADSEKYQLKGWETGRHDSLGHLLRRLNRIRKQHPALQAQHGFHLHPTDNSNLLVYSKRRGPDTVLVIVNMDWHNTQSGLIDLDLSALGLSGDYDYQVHDLISDARYRWSGARNYVSLSPDPLPAHVFEILELS